MAASKRKDPTMKVGNYRAPVDTAGVDPEMLGTMAGKDQAETPISKLLKKFVQRKPKK